MYQSLRVACCGSFACRQCRLSIRASVIAFAWSPVRIFSAKTRLGAPDSVTIPDAIHPSTFSSQTRPLRPIKTTYFNALRSQDTSSAKLQLLSRSKFLESQERSGSSQNEERSWRGGIAKPQEVRPFKVT